MLNHHQILTLLNVRGCNKHHVRRLIDHAANQQATPRDTAGLCRLLAEVCHLPCSEADITAACHAADSILRDCQHEGIGITARGDDDFPQMLRSVLHEGREVAPVLLYWQGRIQVLGDMRGVAVVGTRRVTRQGYADGAYMAGELARHGINIISGLAAGADTAAHSGALAAKGVTTAITAFGLAATPKDSASLSLRILNGDGLLVTEYAPRTSPSYKTLIERDYMQAGLAQALLLVQSNIKRGGSMYAVRTAIENLRPVYAVDYRGTPSEGDHFVQANRQLIESGKALPVTRSSFLSIRDAIG